MKPSRRSAGAAHGHDDHDDAQLAIHDRGDETVAQARLPFLDLISGLNEDYGFEYLPEYVQLIPYPATTLVEQQIAAVLNAVRNKSNWAAKFRDSPAIRSKWRNELEAQMHARNKLRVLRYAFKELAWQAEDEPLAAGPDNVFASDTIVPERVRLQLVELAAKLEDVPEHQKDWHPYSNDQVLDLVHPSLFPVVYGKTCAFPPDDPAQSVHESVSRACAAGVEVIYAPEENVEPYDERFLSSQFQWLPAEIQVAKDGESAEFMSYINNLHPDDHGELYEVLGQAFASMIPLFEETLKRVDCPRPLRICTSPDLWFNMVPNESSESEQEMIRSDDEYRPAQPEVVYEQDANDPWNEPKLKVDHKNDYLPAIDIADQVHSPPLDNDDAMDVDLNSSDGDHVMTAAEMLAAVSSDDSMDNDASYHPSDHEDDEDEYPFETYQDHALDEFAPCPVSVTGELEGLASFGSKTYSHVYRPKVPSRFVPPPPVNVSIVSPHSQLAGKRLQVIVKLANIHLTPDNPTYAGGSWHVEGMLNESIIATGLYYYAMDNITESRLHFRTFVQPPPVDHQQHTVFRDIFGMDESGNGFILCQPKGHITAHEGRAVVFPNLYQHKVAPFELKDKSRPGYRKILAFFLVDPEWYDHVWSSALVPPQQADWVMREVAKGNEDLSDAARMTLDEAKEVRLALMEERSMGVDLANQLAYGAEYNLCEH